MEDLRESALVEIEHFFASYNQFKDKQFEVEARSGPQRAREIVDQATRRAAAES